MDDILKPSVFFGKFMDGGGANFLSGGGGSDGLVLIKAHPFL